MEDLTITSWVGLARALGKGSDDELRAKFLAYMKFDVGQLPGDGIKLCSENCT